MTVIAIKNELIIANITDLASAANNIFTIPVKKITGNNTTKVASVDAKTGIATSDAPSKAACFGERPLSSFLLMFSNTTMELS